MEPWLASGDAQVMRQGGKCYGFYIRSVHQYRVQLNVLHVPDVHALRHLVTFGCEVARVMAPLDQADPCRRAIQTCLLVIRLVEGLYLLLG